MDVNKSQKMAIAHKEGAMMVLAGPGSGKTTVITRRTAALITEGGVAPENILVITFTRAAAAEMKERFAALTGGRFNSVNFGTFHAVFFKILKYAYNYNSGSILTEEERYSIIRDAVYGLKRDIQDEKDLIAQLSAEISSVKNSDIDPANYYSVSCGAEDFRRVYGEYNRRLKNAGKIDFDDMTLQCLELLKEREDICSFWQDRYRYILIDEFQDINLLQYKIIRLLARPRNNIFIVGDDDQSIYGFRGAKPGIMLGFEKDFSGAARVVLDRNYRCGDEVIRLSRQLIAKNRQRFDKQIEGASGRKGSVKFAAMADVRTESNFVVNSILRNVREGGHFGGNAVLYRINSQPRDLIEILREYNIPYEISERIPDIYDHWITQNMDAYMQLAGGSRERKLFLQIANRPKRYISRDMFYKEEMTFDELEKACEDKPYVLKNVNKLRYDLEFLKGLDPYASVKYIRKAMGYDLYLREYADYRHIPAEELMEVLDELEEGLKGFACYRDWRAYVEEYREEQRQKQKKGETEKLQDAVRLLTFHSAKGLEFDNVYIIDVNESITPYRKAELRADIEEERRMFYVAMTRAREKLYLVYEKERFGKSIEPSSFLKELGVDFE